MKRYLRTYVVFNIYDEERDCMVQSKPKRVENRDFLSLFAPSKNTVSFDYFDKIVVCHDDGRETFEPAVLNKETHYVGIFNPFEFMDLMNKRQKEDLKRQGYVGEFSRFIGKKDIEFYIKKAQSEKIVQVYELKYSEDLKMLESDIIVPEYQNRFTVKLNLLNEIAKPIYCCLCWHPNDVVAKRMLALHNEKQAEIDKRYPNRYDGLFDTAAEYSKLKKALGETGISQNESTKSEKLKNKVYSLLGNFTKSEVIDELSLRTKYYFEMLSCKVGPKSTDELIGFELIRVGANHCCRADTEKH